jgi:hypothetical protein
MNKKLLFSQLNLGTTGTEILSILDVLVADMNNDESSQDSVSNLDENQV